MSFTQAGLEPLSKESAPVLTAAVDCAMQDSSVGKRNAPKVLVFANRIKTVRFVQQSLLEAGFKAVQLHGDRSQPEREVSSLSEKK